MDAKKGVTVALAAAGLLVGAGAGALSTRPPTAGPAPIATQWPDPAQVGEPARFVVHVSGWVVAPGLVEVAEGALLVDAIAAAGGAREGARLDLVNLAGLLSPGDRVDIPGPGAPEGPAGSTEAAGGLVPLNRADASTLESLPGVGPVLAQRIVAHREAHGPFQVVEDLLDVPGIGEAKLAAIRDLVSLR